MKPIVWLAVPLTVVVAAGLWAINFRTSERVLTFDGLAPVRLGMTVAEAEAALGAKFDPMEPDNGVDTESCWITSRAGNTDPGVSYRIEYGRITRIDVYDYSRSPEEGPAVPSVVTERGIGLLSSVNEVKSVYGPGLIVKFHSQGDEGNYDLLYMKVLNPDGRSGLLFVTRRNGLTEIGSATVNAIDAEEGCV